MTTIKNTKTGEIVEITLINPQYHGQDISGEILGNAGDESLIYTDEHDGVDFLADAETIDWWVDFCQKYQEAMDALDEVLCDNDIDKTEFEQTYADFLGNTDLEGLPAEMMGVVEMIKSQLPETISAEVFGDVYRLRANFSEASDPIQQCIDGEWEDTGRQVADFCHSPEAAMRHHLEAVVKDGGDDPEDEDCKEEIDDAIRDMCRE